MRLGLESWGLVLVPTGPEGGGPISVLGARAVLLTLGPTRFAVDLTEARGGGGGGGGGPGGPGGPGVPDMTTEGFKGQQREGS